MVVDKMYDYVNEFFVICTVKHTALGTVCSCTDCCSDNTLEL